MNRTWMTILICCMLSATAANAQWYVHYVRGLQAVKHHQWQEAVAELSAAIEEKPNPQANARTDELYFIDYLPLLYRAVAYYHLQQFEKAEEDLFYANSFGQVEKAHLDKNAGRLFQRYLLLLNKQKEIERLISRGVEFFRQQDYARAIRTLKKISMHDIGYGRARKYLKMAERQMLIKREMADALALIKQRRYQAAVEKFIRIKGLDPGYPNIDAMLERTRGLLVAREQPVRTNGSIDRELAAQVAWLSKSGIRLFNENRLEEAESKFKRILQLTNYDAQAVRYLYLIKQRKRQKVPAESPTQTSVASMYTEAVEHFEQENLSRSKELLLQILKEKPNHAQANSQLGKIADIERKLDAGIQAFRSGNYQKAITLLSQIIQKHEQIVEAHAYLGSAYAAQYFLGGERNRELYAQAIASFRKVKQIDGDYLLDENSISPKIIEIYLSA